MDPADYPDTGNRALDEVNLEEGAPFDGKAIHELGSAMEVLTRVDLDLAYSYEKLGNLHILFTHALAWENDFEAVDMNSDSTSEDSFEKTLVFHLLSGILDSEVKELDSFTYSLQEDIDNARKNIYSYRHLREIFSVMEEKLHNTEKSWEQSQEQVLDMKMLSAKLERATLADGNTNWKNDKGMDFLLEDNQVLTINAKSKLQNVEQQRYILRMAERSLARELDLEKRFLESRENEEDLKLKLHHTEQVAFHMEEAAEAAWGRLLEAENAAEVLMGTSKDLLSRLQIIQFNLNGSMQRETAVKSELQNCLEQLKATEAALQKNDSSREKPQILEQAQTTSSQVCSREAEEKCIADNSEVFSLREKVKLLEEQLTESEEWLKNWTSVNEASEEKLSTMENIIDTLKESISEAESRAESAETKFTELTDTNLELTEELNFLKGSDSKAEKVSLLEKQLRELEIQLQHAKASSEASQEQQNMLYSAIWDMETLIEDLKSKVSKAEIKTENAEEQCVILSETIFEINKELNFMRVRTECLETSLCQANDEKEASAEDINIRSKLIMDMVMKLAIERERIQKELYSLTKENKMLVERLQRNKTEATVFTCEKGDGDDRELLFSNHDSSQTTITEANDGVMESSLPSLQVDESSKHESVCETDIKSSSSATNIIGIDPKIETVQNPKVGQLSRMYILVAVVVALISMLAIYLFHKHPHLSAVLND